ncbi:MAG: GTPase Era [Pseudomonadota bacterium]
MSDSSRCGFVAVIGRPNVGKSTLINRIVGRKVSIVTPKPQTTRHRILGVHTTAEHQIVFVDTPGLHDSEGKVMNRLMNRTAGAALTDADVVLFVSEASAWKPQDERVLERIKAVAQNLPVFAVLNKVDRIKRKSALLEDIAQMSDRFPFAEIVPLSAKQGENVDRLIGSLPPYLPVSPPLFPADSVTDRSELFLASELIREKLTYALRDELPYGVAVQIERMRHTEQGVEVDAVIWVERESQKGIVIGKGGAQLKAIGQQARQDLIRHLDQRVHLELWVKVKDNWANSEAELQKLGYDIRE